MVTDSPQIYRELTMMLVKTLAASILFMCPFQPGFFRGSWLSDRYLLPILWQPKPSTIIIIEQILLKRVPSRFKREHRGRKHSNVAHDTRSRMSTPARAKFKTEQTNVRASQFCCCRLYFIGRFVFNVTERQVSDKGAIDGNNLHDRSTLHVQPLDGKMELYAQHRQPGFCQQPKPFNAVPPRL